MANYSEYYKARKIVADILKDDFIGPVLQDEVLSEIPTQYYLMGKLYPQGENDESLDLARNPFLENKVETYDASISLSNQQNPASMGITCSLKADVTKIRVNVEYAFYEPIEFDDAENHGISIEKWKDADEDKRPRNFWKRKNYSNSKVVQLGNSGVELADLEGNLQIHVYTHAIIDNKDRVITVVLLNENKADNDVTKIAQLCAFQAAISIEGVNNDEIFSTVRKQSWISNDPELMELEMLYSDVDYYGQGHGCSVDWDRTSPSPKWVRSEWMPSYNLHQMMAAELPDSDIFGMNYLSSADDMDIIKKLYSFANEYKNWIDNDLFVKAKKLPKELDGSAKINIANCNKAYDRIVDSIRCLEDSAKTKDRIEIRAFKLANEAMFEQRKRTVEKSKKTFDEHKATWYPFQLAFILHELTSFIDPHGESRKIADLLWFPTGGGKTEAYLGIAAFAIFLRRLRNANDDGVTVIMRYTLRLLTLQQFERASMLIIACELLRRKYKLGGSEISMGLWVGGKLTPNSLADARASINKQKIGAVVNLEEKNPCQIQVCPWCGEKIVPDNYSVSIPDQRMRITCDNPSCACHKLENGLPVHIIDEAIYRHLPTFLVATVDKFAQIPLSDKPAALFGISTHKNPPELIIQDELHLISGPLGTMTGIYEAAVTRLCQKNDVGIKIIASTATIRNAANQIKALYGKDYSQFPPQGISAKNSFFAVEASPEKRPAREYFGVMGIGTTATTTLIRVNAALLYATRYLALLGFSDEVVDNFWTITGYFNSLRELGGASTQILDDVQSRFSYLAKTKFSHKTPQVDSDKTYDKTVELTSRMNNTEITKVIQVYLKRGYKDGKHSDVYDFVLASNMISVGVDVGRLGTMVVAGQPKTNAEYIQSTSRVGRENPGLVVTVYNASRSRDRSHYEQFLKYHSALYRYVEATSLTPFADRARDRGLHALYVSLCRYLVPGMLENANAVKYVSSNPEFKKIEDMICDYVKIVDKQELAAVLDELNTIEDTWNMEATGSLVYKTYKNEKALLKNDTVNDRFRTMNSMRNVDAQCGIYLLGR